MESSELAAIRDRFYKTRKSPAVWTESAVLALLRIIEEKGVLPRIQGRSQRNSAIFRSVRKSMAELGFVEYRSEQLRDKWKNLKRNYYRISRELSECSISARSLDWVFYEPMHKLLNSIPIDDKHFTDTDVEGALKYRILDRHLPATKTVTHYPHLDAGCRIAVRVLDSPHVFQPHNPAEQTISDDGSSRTDAGDLQISISNPHHPHSAADVDTRQTTSDNIPRPPSVDGSLGPPPLDDDEESEETSLVNFDDPTRSSDRSTAKDTGIQELIAAFREESEKDRQLMKQMFTELIDVLKSNKPT